MLGMMIPGFCCGQFAIYFQKRVASCGTVAWDGGVGPYDLTSSLVYFLHHPSSVLQQHNHFVYSLAPIQSTLSKCRIALQSLFSLGSCSVECLCCLGWTDGSVVMRATVYN